MNPMIQHLLTHGASGADGGDWCYGSLQVCAFRISLLAASGAPLTGAANGLANNTLITAKIGVELEPGSDLTLKNGCGGLCQTFKDGDKVKGVNIDMELCTLDSQMIQMIVGGDVFRDLSGTGLADIIGYQLPLSTDDSPDGVCLELWSKAWDGTAQAAPTFAGGDPVYFHWVFPKVSFSLGEMTMEDDFMRIPVSGFGSENLAITANGPFDDWPVDIAAAGGINAAGGWFFDTDLPAPSCEAIAVTSAAS